MNTNEYTDLIAGFHYGKPKFTEWIFTLTEPLRIARERLASMVEAFSVDHATGEQLDAVGVRVGIGRGVPTKIDGIFFAFDDVDGFGFDFGVWKGAHQSADGVTELDDSTYRNVIKAKILENHWDGTNESRRNFLNQLEKAFGLPEGMIYIQDFQDMSVDILIQRDKVPKILIELIERRVVDFISAGVQVNFRDYEPLFGLDEMTTGIQGLDSSVWRQ